MVGKTVVLTSCLAAEIKDNQVMACQSPVSGLFFIEEFNPIEPSNYQWTSTHTIVSLDTGKIYDVDSDILFSQVDPKSYAESLRYEREMAWILEN